MLKISPNSHLTQIATNHIAFDSSRRAEHEYANEKLRNPNNKKVMGSQNSKIENQQGDPYFILDNTTGLEGGSKVLSPDP
jgi:hypothetical protein